jgi:microcystin-dependent protein
MSQQYVGEIRLFPFGFAPRTWAYCSGQMLAISQNQVLFATQNGPRYMFGLRYKF